MTPTFTFRLSRRASRAALIALLAGAAPAVAQDAQSNTALPQTIPGLGNFSIAPNNRLSPVPLPSSTPTPTPAPIPAAPATRTPIAPPRLTIEPLPTATPTPRTVPLPRARPTPAPRPTTAAPTPTPAVAPTPAATPAAVVTPVSPPSQPAAAVQTPAPAAAATPLHPSKVWIFVLLAILVLPGAVVAAWFYRRALPAGGFAPAVDDDDDDWVAPAEPAPVAAPPAPAPAVPVPRQTPGSTARAQIEVTFRPRRAGTNLTSAAVDCELVVRNTGSAPARDVRLSVALITAGNAHDAELHALFDNGGVRPVVAPFDLAPGADKTVKAMAMLPKEAINVVSVKGRPMFVPMVAINVLYEWNGGSGQTASSHVVGIAGSGGERMRPFWLDQAQRMHDGVSEHAHSVTVRR